MSTLVAKLREALAIAEAMDPDAYSGADECGAPGSPSLAPSALAGDESYQEFLRNKIRLAPSYGFEVPPEAINPQLKDFVREAVVPWAAAGGRRAIFSSFGLHKTSVQLELARLALKLQNATPLIVLPLGVRQEFFDDASRFFTGEYAVRLNFIRRTEEAQRDAINLTNYESVREGKIDATAFDFVSLDEAAVLRGFGGTKTFREFMRIFDGVKYRFVATATPDPNEFIELLAYSAFLGIMDVGQAKTRFFKRDSVNADKLTPHAHKEREFWLWVASWALFVRKPSDLGYADDGYEMPPLDVRWHEVPSDHKQAGADQDGQQRMFRDPTISISETAKEKRITIGARIATLRLIIDEARRPELPKGIPAEKSGETPDAEPSPLSGEQGSLQSPFEGVAGREPCAGERISAETSRGQSGESACVDAEVVSEEQGPGACRQVQKVVRDHTGAIRGAVDCPERPLRDLPGRTAAAHAASHRPLSCDEETARTSLPQVQRRAGPLRGPDPDADARDSLSDQLVIWCDLNDEQRAIEHALTDAGVSHSSLYGSQDIEEREDLLRAWKTKRTTAFVSKPVMYGAGVNMQQCHTMIFAGIGFKFAELIQAIHRCQRFGQRERVTVHLIYSEAERPVRRTLEDKWRRHDQQAEIMSAIIREYGLTRMSLAASLQRSIGVTRREVFGDNYRLINNDCIEELPLHADHSAALIVTSIPFSTQYEYTPSYNDFGHSDDDAQFWRQMDFLTPQLLRVLKPGRVACVHVKDRIVPGGINGLGFQTVSPFSDDCVAHFRKHGFAFLARKTITTDVVRENNQTYRLGWSEQCKDGSRMGAGLPEYLLLFRKPPSDLSNGYADEPVVKEKPLCDDHGAPAPFDEDTNWKHPIPGTGYSRARWQFDAHGFMRSSGDRLLTRDELRGLKHQKLYRLWRDRSEGLIYDFETHVRLAEEMDHAARLPSTFMLLPPHSWHPDVWSDVARMRTLNMIQQRQGREMHLCPLQFDVVERCITQLSMPGETVLDPFGGIMTVPWCALKQGRQGIGIELSADYFSDGAAHVQGLAEQFATPSLFDTLSDAETSMREAAE